MLTHIEAKLTEGMHAHGRTAGALTTPGVPNIPRYARSERAGRLQQNNLAGLGLPSVVAPVEIIENRIDGRYIVIRQILGAHVCLVDARLACQR